MSGRDIMPLPPDTRAVVDDLMQDLDVMAGRIAETQIARDTNGVIEGWEGKAHSEHLGAVRALGRHARDLVDEFPNFINPLQQWRDALTTAIDVTVPPLWERYDAAQSAFDTGYDDLAQDITLHRQVGEPLTQTEIDARYGALVDARDGTFTEVMDEYRTAMDALDDAANTAATSIRGVLDSLIGEGVAPTDRAALAAHLFDDVTYVDGVNDWAWALDEAPEAADALRGAHDPESLQEFWDKYGEYMDDPYFARAMLGELSPEEMARISHDLHLLANQSGEDDGTIIDDILAGMGALVVLGTGGTTTAPDAAGQQTDFLMVEDGLRTKDGQTVNSASWDWARALADSGGVEYDTEGNPLPEDRQNYGFGYYGYEYITDMLRRAGENEGIALGEPFLEHVAPSIVEWDHKTLPYRGSYGEFLWQRGFSPPPNDPIDVMARLMDTPEGMEAQATVVNEAEVQRMDAVRKFFNSETSFDTDPNSEGEQPMNMTRYLTGHRFGTYYTGTLDAGESLGRILDQASQPAEDGSIDETRANIAANFLAGYQDGLDYEGADNLYRGEDIFGSTHSALRSWSGLILQEHLEGIAESLQSPDTSSLRVRDSDIHPGKSVIVLGDDLKDRLLDPQTGFFVDIAFDNPAVVENGAGPGIDGYENGRAPASVNLMLASQQGYQEDAAYYLAENQIDRLDRAAGKWGALTEVLLTTPEIADGNVKADIDARNAQMQSLIEMGIGALPLSEVFGKGEDTLNYFAGQAKGIGVAAALEYLLPTDNAAGTEGSIDDAHDAAERQMKDSFYQAVSQYEHWSDAGGAVLPQDWSVHDPSRRIVDDDNNVIPYDQMTTAQKESFRDFLNSEQSGQGGIFGEEISNIDSALNDAKLEREEADS